MAALFIENRDLELIERERAADYRAVRPIFEILPFEAVNAQGVAWQVRDNLKGLLPMQGQDDPLSPRDVSGYTEFLAKASFFGESFTVSASRLAKLGTPGVYGGVQRPTTLDDLVAMELADSQARCWDTVEYLGWQLLSKGIAYAIDRNGATQTVAQWTPLQTGGAQYFYAGTAWTTYATSTPIKDLESTCISLRGRGFDFRGGKAYANSATWLAMLQNTNTADLAGRKGPGLSTLFTLDEVSKSFRGLIPELVPIDTSYLDSNGDPVFSIPDGYIVMVGRHPQRGLMAGDTVSTLIGGRPDKPEPDLFVAVSRPSPDNGGSFPYVPKGELALSFGHRLNFGRQVAVFKAY